MPCRALDVESFFKRNDGNVAIPFALLIVFLIGCVGVAVDSARRYAVQIELQAATDAAVLFYVKQHDVVQAEALARKMFDSNASALAKAALKGVKFEFKTQSNENIISAIGTFSAEVDTTFMRVLGETIMSADGTAAATTTVKSKIDFHVLTDTSDSMGLASDTAQQSSLMYFTTQEYLKGKLVSSHSNCAFACHKNQGSKTTTLAVARTNSVDLRIDVARRGVVKLIAKSQKAENVESRYSLYTFNSDLYEIQPITSNLKQAAKRAELIEVGYGRTAAQDSDTSFDTITPKFVERLKSHRTTLDAKEPPEQVIILVSDGLKSQNCAACAGRQNVYPFKQEHCNLIKASGYKLAVIYTEYLQMPFDKTYQDHASHAVPLIENNMKACASPGLYAKGDTAKQIDEAFDHIFAVVSQDLHLSQ